MPHVRVRRLSAPSGDGRKVAGGWWPPLMLACEWIGDTHARFEVFHICFGCDSPSSEQLGQVIDASQIAGEPPVSTIHDLPHSHQPPTLAPDSHVDPFVAAHKLVTLTVGAVCETNPARTHQG